MINQIGGNMDCQQMHINAIQWGNEGINMFKMPNLTCISCGLNGHTIVRCYKSVDILPTLSIKQTTRNTSYLMQDLSFFF